MCFPALASSAAVGLGFLSQWEGMFLNSYPGYLADGTNASRPTANRPGRQAAMTPVSGAIRKVTSAGVHPVEND